LAEECNTIYFNLTWYFIVFISPSGMYVKYATSDKNYDPEYTKVPEIADTKKSYNIACNSYFQSRMLNENLRQYAQVRRVDKK
jgi:hypothetical protein